ncbi:uncharacterized protein PG986_008829 [Apiospora aurea]|uniref:CCHC-type domain-containing protein n=1 Tax=Apiospora aurea TaxID=335848 RepID=A0ABR1Q603_9PEZI
MDDAVAAVQDELLKASRSALIGQVRLNDVSVNWYNWRIDHAMFTRVVKDQKFPYDAPNSSSAPHSSEWATFWIEQVDSYIVILNQTVVDEHRAEPIEVDANGIAADVGVNDAVATPAIDTTLPAMAQSSIVPRQVVWTCANCDEAGHTLGDCVTPKIGDCDIDGCPLCNTKRHSFDECRNTQYLGTEAILNMLYFRRSGKCQIRSDREIYVLLKQYAEQLESHGVDVVDMLKITAPWTRSFTAKFLRNPESADKMKAYSYLTKNLQPLETDTSVNIDDIMGGKVSSSYSAYHKQQTSAACDTLMEKKDALEGFRKLALENLGIA